MTLYENGRDNWIRQQRYIERTVALQRAQALAVPPLPLRNVTNLPAKRKADGLSTAIEPPATRAASRPSVRLPPRPVPVGPGFVPEWCKEICTNRGISPAVPPKVLDPDKQGFVVSSIVATQPEKRLQEHELRTLKHVGGLIIARRMGYIRHNKRHYNESRESEEEPELSGSDDVTDERLSKRDLARSTRKKDREEREEAYRRHMRRTIPLVVPSEQFNTFIVELEVAVRQDMSAVKIIELRSEVRNATERKLHNHNILRSSWTMLLHMPDREYAKCVREFMNLRSKEVIKHFELDPVYRSSQALRKRLLKHAKVIPMPDDEVMSDAPPVTAAAMLLTLPSVPSSRPQPIQPLPGINSSVRPTIDL